jgi:glyoxylase-like metal-dependent hydrolase (beta-lactamase superfamily II)
VTSDPHQAPDAGLPAWLPQCDDPTMGAQWQFISDGSMAYPREFIFPNQAPDELARAGVGAEVVTPYNCLLIDAAGQTVLVDAGIARAGPPQATAGRLLDSLAAAGVATDDIDVVVITHGHADHVGGLVSEGKPVFAAARHYLARAEWDFWMSEDVRTRIPEPLADMLITAARGGLTAVADAGLLEQIDPPMSPLPGVTLLGAPGHTPGHLAVEITDAEPPLLYLTDAILHVLQFEHLDWTSLVDVDPPTTVKTRRALLEHASEANLLVAGFHLGRTGRISRDGEVYRFPT